MPIDSAHTHRRQTGLHVAWDDRHARSRDQARQHHLQRAVFRFDGRFDEAAARSRAGAPRLMLSAIALGAVGMAAGFGMTAANATPRARGGGPHSINGLNEGLNTGPVNGPADAALAPASAHTTLRPHGVTQRIRPTMHIRAKRSNDVCPITTATTTTPASSAPQADATAAPASSPSPLAGATLRVPVGLPDTMPPLLEPAAYAELEAVAERLSWLDMDRLRNMVSSAADALAVVIHARGQRFDPEEIEAMPARLDATIDGLSNDIVNEAALIYYLATRPDTADPVIAFDLFGLRYSFTDTLTKELRRDKLFVKPLEAMTRPAPAGEVQFNGFSLENSAGYSVNDLTGLASVRRALHDMPGQREHLVSLWLHEHGISTEYRFGTASHALASVILSCTGHQVRKTDGLNLLAEFARICERWEARRIGVDPRLMLAMHLDTESATPVNRTGDANAKLRQMMDHARERLVPLDDTAAPLFDARQRAIDHLKSVLGVDDDFLERELPVTFYLANGGQEVRCESVIQGYMRIADEHCGSSNSLEINLRNRVVTVYPARELEQFQTQFNADLAQNPWVRARATENLRERGVKLPTENEIRGEIGAVCDTLKVSTTCERESERRHRVMLMAPIIGPVFAFIEGLANGNVDETLGAIPVVGNVKAVYEAVRDNDGHQFVEALPVIGSIDRIDDARKEGDYAAMGLSAAGLGLELASLFEGGMAGRPGVTRARAKVPAHRLPRAMQRAVHQAWAVGNHFDLPVHGITMRNRNVGDGRPALPVTPRDPFSIAHANALRSGEIRQLPGSLRGHHTETLPENLGAVDALGLRRTPEMPPHRGYLALEGQHYLVSHIGGGIWRVEAPEGASAASGARMPLLRLGASHQWEAVTPLERILPEAPRHEIVGLTQEQIKAFRAKNPPDPDLVSTAHPNPVEIANRQFINLRGRIFQVRFDENARTFRLFNEENPSKPGPAVRYNAERYVWEVHTETGLRGGMMAAGGQPMQAAGGGVTLAPIDHAAGMRADIELPPAYVTRPGQGRFVSDMYSARWSEWALTRARDVSLRSDYRVTMAQYFDVQGAIPGFDFHERMGTIYENSPTFRRLFNYAADRQFHGQVLESLQQGPYQFHEYASAAKIAVNNRAGIDLFRSVVQAQNPAEGWRVVLKPRAWPITNFLNRAIDLSEHDPTGAPVTLHVFPGVSRTPGLTRTALHEMVHALTGMPDISEGDITWYSSNHEIPAAIGYNEHGPIVLLTERILRETGNQPEERLGYPGAPFNPLVPDMTTLNAEFQQRYTQRMGVAGNTAPTIAEHGLARKQLQVAYLDAMFPNPAPPDGAGAAAAHVP